MSLTSGKRVVHYRWTELPIPQDMINRVSAIGCWQKMPSTVTYANCHGTELGDTIADYPDDDSSSDNDSLYQDSAWSDDPLAIYDSDLSSNSDSNSDSHSVASSSSSSSSSDGPDDNDNAVADADPPFEFKSDEAQVNSRSASAPSNSIIDAQQHAPTPVAFRIVDAPVAFSTPHVCCSSRRLTYSGIFEEICHLIFASLTSPSCQCHFLPSFYTSCGSPLQIQSFSPG